MVVATQVSVFGLYRPPLLSKGDEVDKPPQTIISLPVQTACEVCTTFGGVRRAGGCPTIRAGIVSAAGVQ